MAVRPAWIAAVAVPVAAFAALLARPNIDKVWESHPAHFWTVLTAAAASVARRLGRQQRAAAGAATPASSSSRSRAW